MEIMGVRGSLAWALACWAGMAVDAAAGTPLHVRVVDDATGRTVSGRAYLRRGDEPLLPAGFSSYARGDERHFLVPGDFELDLEPGKYRRPVRFDRSSWAAVRAFERSDRSEVFAHTSPVYFFLDGKPVVVAPLPASSCLLQACSLPRPASAATHAVRPMPDRIACCSGSNRLLFSRHGSS